MCEKYQMKSSSKNIKMNWTELKTFNTQKQSKKTNIIIVDEILLPLDSMESIEVGCHERSSKEEKEKNTVQSIDLEYVF